MKPAGGWIMAIASTALVLAIVVAQSGLDAATIAIGLIVALLIIGVLGALQRGISYVELEEKQLIWSHWAGGRMSPRHHEAIDYDAIAEIRRAAPGTIEIHYHPRLKSKPYAYYTTIIRVQPKQPERLIADLQRRLPSTVFSEGARRLV